MKDWYHFPKAHAELLAMVIKQAEEQVLELSIGELEEEYELDWSHLCVHAAGEMAQTLQAAESFPDDDGEQGGKLLLRAWVHAFLSGARYAKLNDHYDEGDS